MTNETSARNDSLQSEQKKRARVLLNGFQAAIHRRTDHMFAVLMVLQWLGGILIACTVSPRTWLGDVSEVHLHVWAAFLLGGLISSLPVTLAILLPGRPITRHAVAVGQMFTSALLIHLTGGR